VIYSLTLTGTLASVGF